MRPDGDQVQAGDEIGNLDRQPTKNCRSSRRRLRHLGTLPIGSQEARQGRERRQVIPYLTALESI